MKPSVCAVCGEKTAPLCYEVEVTVRTMFLNHNKANTLLGATRMLGNSLALAEAMSGVRQDELFDELNSTQRVYNVCQDCFMGEFQVTPVYILEEGDED